MLYRETIAVRSQIRTKHTNTLCQHVTMLPEAEGKVMSLSNAQHTFCRHDTLTHPSTYNPVTSSDTMQSGSRFQITHVVVSSFCHF